MVVIAAAIVGLRSSVVTADSLTVDDCVRLALTRSPAVLWNCQAWPVLPGP